MANIAIHKLLKKISTPTNLKIYNKQSGGTA